MIIHSYNQYLLITSCAKPWARYWTYALSLNGWQRNCEDHAVNPHLQVPKLRLKEGKLPMATEPGGGCLLFGTQKGAAWSAFGTGKLRRMPLHQRDTDSPGQRKWGPSWEAVGPRPWEGSQGSPKGRTLVFCLGKWRCSLWKFLCPVTKWLVEAHSGSQACS